VFRDLALTTARMPLFGVSTEGALHPPGAGGIIVTSSSPSGPSRSRALGASKALPVLHGA
jgi:hypothetical protein